MPKKPLVQFEPESLRNFNDLLEEMQEVTGAELKKVIRNTSRDMAFSLIKVTPIAPSGVRARGFAKAGWLKSLRELGVTPRAEFDKAGGEAAERLSDFVDGLDEAQPFTELINQVPFIEEIGGAVLELAIADTSMKLEKRLTRMSRKLAGTWAR